MSRFLWFTVYIAEMYRLLQLPDGLIEVRNHSVVSLLSQFCDTTNSSNFTNPLCISDRYRARFIRVIIPTT